MCAQRVRKTRVPQSAEKLSIRNPLPIVTHVSHVVMVPWRARAGVRHGGASGPQVGLDSSLGLRCLLFACLSQFLCARAGVVTAAA